MLLGDGFNTKDNRRCRYGLTELALIGGLNKASLSLQQGAGPDDRPWTTQLIDSERHSRVGYSPPLLTPRSGI